MDDFGTAILTIILSALVASVTALFVDKIKLKNRLRLENEYQILMKIWEKVYKVKSKSNSLRPKHGIPANSDEKKQERLNYFAKSMDEFKQEMYLNKPFYPQEIHALLDNLRVETHMEAFSFNHTSPENSRKYWDDAARNTKKINELVDQICNAIRDHIHGHVRLKISSKTSGGANTIDNSTSN